MEWKRRTTELMQGQPQPTLTQLRNLVNRAATIPVKLDLVNEVSVEQAANTCICSEMTIISLF